MKRAARVDVTAKALTAVARKLGVQVLLLGGGPIDAVWHWRGKVWLVDYKSPKGGLTETQARLVTDGWPITFVRTTDDVLNLVSR